MVVTRRSLRLVIHNEVSEHPNIPLPYRHFASACIVFEILDGSPWLQVKPIVRMWRGDDPDWAMAQDNLGSALLGLASGGASLPA
jgi:hypothetical protein